MNDAPETLAALISDEGRRFSEAHNLARVAGGQGRWIAVRLSDGGTDGAVYDTRPDAIRHQLHERQCYYCLVQQGTMTPREATAIINAVRNIYATGKVDLADPNGPVGNPLPAQDLAQHQAFARLLDRSGAVRHDRRR